MYSAIKNYVVIIEKGAGLYKIFFLFLVRFHLWFSLVYGIVCEIIMKFVKSGE